MNAAAYDSTRSSTNGKSGLCLSCRERSEEQPADVRLGGTDITLGNVQMCSAPKPYFRGKERSLIRRAAVTGPRRIRVAASGVIAFPNNARIIQLRSRAILVQSFGIDTFLRLVITLNSYNCKRPQDAGNHRKVKSKLKISVVRPLARTQSSRTQSFKAHQGRCLMQCQ